MASRNTKESAIPFIVNLIAGIILVFGGYMGYTKGSNTSLFAGSGSGVALVLTAVMMKMNKLREGVLVSTCITGLLTLIMGYRYINTHGTIPGVVAAISTITFLVDAYWIVKHGRAPQAVD